MLLKISYEIFFPEGGKFGWTSFGWGRSRFVGSARRARD
jgi:hypothetical protein